MTKFKTLVRLLSFVSSVLSLVVSSGCSLIGLGIGAIADASKPDTVAISDLQVFAIRQGTPCSITLYSGDTLIGKFVGTERMPSEKYAERYALSREHNEESIPLPALGDSILLRLTNGQVWKGTLSGFDRNHLVFQHRDQAPPAKASLAEIDAITNKNDDFTIKGKTLRDLILAGKVALLTDVVIRTDASSEVRVALDEISQIEVPVRKNAKIKGFGVGAAVDGALLVYFLCCFEPIEVQPFNSSGN